jgi:tetratricopeptide (TPR) repeat protein
MTNPMRHIARKSALFVVLCCSAQAVFAHKDAEPKDLAEASSWIQEALRSFSNVKVTESLILYQERNQTFSIALPRISDITYTEQKRNSYPYCVSWRDYANDGPAHICWGYKKHKDSERFAAAMAYVSAAARQNVQSGIDADWAHFQEQLKPWREATSKPSMPESAREHQVLAEYAFKEKNTEKAMVEYTEALKVFSTWPEGQFNLATLCGEAKHYQCAILHMKEYLELAPDSPDAQAAKDSIIIWNDKLSAFRAAMAQDTRSAQPGKSEHPVASAR